jgi:hypothetical protein
MRRLVLFAATALLATAAMAGSADAGSDPTTAAGTLPAPGAAGQGDASLLLSIRSLAVSPTQFTAPPAEVERVTAPTGAGATRWPSATTPVGRGVYISVMPACIPGVDEPLWSGPPRTRRR